MRRNSELKCGPAESDQTAGAGQAAEPDKTAESGQTAGGAAFSAGREFAKYTFLNVLGMFGLSCYILADTFFVSKGLGTNGLAAGLTGVWLAFPITEGIVCAAGGAVYRRST